MTDEPVASFVRVIFEGPDPVRVFFECLHCDEPMVVDKKLRCVSCPDCGTVTPFVALGEHLQQCVDVLKE